MTLIFDLCIRFLWHNGHLSYYVPGRFGWNLSDSSLRRFTVTYFGLVWPWPTTAAVHVSLAVSTSSPLYQPTSWESGGRPSPWRRLEDDLNVATESAVQTSIIIIIISTTMFMVLSSWQSHCESSPGSFDECRILEWRQAAADPRPSQTT